MKIIIAGAGRVGYYLAKNLCLYHDVIVIDKDIQTIENIKEGLDVLAIDGDICNPNIYDQLNDDNFDYLICVTNSDEANLVASSIINTKLKVKNRIVRLQNNFYKDSSLEHFFVDKAIFPSFKVAMSMDYLLRYPQANNAKKFRSLDMYLLSIRVKNPNFFSKTVQSIENFFEENIVIVGVERDKEFFIPDFDFRIDENDLIYVFGNKDNINNFYNSIKADDFSNKMQSAIIFGATRVGIEIAKVLIKNEVSVKIVEKDLKLCNIAQEQLNGRATILHSRYGWGHLLKEEGLDSADIFIAASEDDEFNIIKSLEAKEADISKIITINNEREYYHLMHSLGLVVIRGEKIDAFYTILENISTDSAINQKRYCGGRGIALYKEILDESKCIDKILKIPKKIQNNSKVLIVSNSQLIKDIQNHNCEPNDDVVCFTTQEYEDIVENWLYQEI